MLRFLRLRNFKCFSDQSFELKALTLLSGLNGMGKSSLLQSLLLLRQSFQRGLLKEKIGLALNGELIQIGNGKDVLFEKAQTDKISIELKLENGAEAQWHFNSDLEANVLNLDMAQYSEKIYSISLFKDNFQYLQAERLGPRSYFEMSDFDVRLHKRIGSKGEYALHYLSVLNEKNYLINPNLAHPSEKSFQIQLQIEAWMDEISPGTRMHFASYKGMNIIDLEYSFEIEKDVGNRFRSANVGFGITYTLPVLLSLLTSSSGSLILIENPEAHLHPSGQVKIGELAARAAANGTQIILESHSDHVLNGIRLAVYDDIIAPEKVQLHYFERATKENEGMVSIQSPKIDQNGRIDKWPEGFFDVWDNCLEALLKPKKVQVK